MSEYVYFGQTSQTIDIFLQDSSSAIGAGLSGLVFNSGGLVASYRKGATGSRTAITLATQTVGGAYSSGGFVEIEATHMKGVYRLDLPNAMVDTEGFVTLYIYGATNLLATALRIDCRPVPSDAKRLGGQNAASFAELASPPAATSSLGDKITWLFMWARNKGIQSTTERKLYADNSTTVVSTEAVTDDGTTYTKAKAS